MEENTETIRVIVLKLISGEEIIGEVIPIDDEEKKTIMMLRDPYIVESVDTSGAFGSFRVVPWVVSGSKESEVAISITKIVTAVSPSKKFAEGYANALVKDAEYDELSEDELSEDEYYFFGDDEVDLDTITEDEFDMLTPVTANTTFH